MGTGFFCPGALKQSSYQADYYANSHEAIQNDGKLRKLEVVASIVSKKA